VRFGLRPLPAGGRLRDLVRQVCLAEEVGFHQVWIPDDAFMSDARTITATLAEHTSRIEIGAMGGLYSIGPADLACYGATLDELSGGRALLRVGAHTLETVGWTGGDASDAIERARETVALTRALIRGETANTIGSVFRWTDQCYLRFTPLRSEIPIYVSAFGPELLATAGEIGDGVLPRLLPPAAARVIVPHIVEGAQRAGRQPSELDIAGCVFVSLAEDRAEAAAPLRPMISCFGRFLEAEVLATAGLATGGLRRGRATGGPWRDGGGRAPCNR
jgi:5,10-methylenetetrahydromethanopterin reductase